MGTRGGRLCGWYGADRVRGDAAPGSSKRAFLADARRFLEGVSRVLEARGWERVQVSANAAGPGAAGEVSGLFLRPGCEVGCYVLVGEMVGPWVSSSRSGISIMYRATTRSRPWGGEFGAGFQNRWDASWDVASAGLAERLQVMVGEVEPPSEGRALEAAAASQGCLF